MKRVCVFCGSSIGARPSYAKAARETASVLVERGLELVYGGGNVGLMKIVADEVLAAGVRALRELTQRHAALQADIQVGIDQLDRGEGEPWDGEAMKAKLDRQLDASQQDS